MNIWKITYALNRRVGSLHCVCGWILVNIHYMVRVYAVVSYIEQYADSDIGSTRSCMFKSHIIYQSIDWVWTIILACYTDVLCDPLELVNLSFSNDANQ